MKIKASKLPKDLNAHDLLYWCEQNGVTEVLNPNPKQAYQLGYANGWGQGQWQEKFCAGERVEDNFKVNIIFGK